MFGRAKKLATLPRAHTSDDGAYSFFTLRDIDMGEVEYVVPTEALDTLISRLSELQMQAALAKKGARPKKLKPSNRFSTRATWTVFRDEKDLDGPGFQVGMTARPEARVAVHFRLDPASFQLLLPIDDARALSALIEQTADDLEQRDVRPVKS